MISNLLLLSVEAIKEHLVSLKDIHNLIEEGDLLICNEGHLYVVNLIGNNHIALESDCVKWVVLKNSNLEFAWIKKGKLASLLFEPKPTVNGVLNK